MKYGIVASAFKHFFGCKSKEDMGIPKIFNRFSVQKMGIPNFFTVFEIKN